MREEPTPYLIQSIKQAEIDRKIGRCSPMFDNAEDAISWLNDDHAQLQNGECVCEQQHE